MEIFNIQKVDGSWPEGNEVVDEAIEFYQDLFNRRLADMDMSVLYLVPSVISEEDNDDLNRPPTFEEVRRVVFELNGDSVCGLDGFTSHFYQAYWDIVGNDMF